MVVRDYAAVVDTNRVVAVLGRGLVPASAPILRADDLGVIRGDGVFETIHVRPGQAQHSQVSGGGRAFLLDQHLDRLTRSAAYLEIILPERAELADLVTLAASAWPAGEEGSLRLVATRGSEDAPGGPATVFASVSPVLATTKATRERGVSVLSASVGRDAVVGGADSSWQLRGAKSISYAVNMASQRWARAAGADELLWTSSDGYVLEAPTATLAWLEGGTLCAVPAETAGILPGITARWLLDHAGELGWTTSERMVTPAEVVAGDGAWLLSSTRGVAAVRTLDGSPLATAQRDTDRIRALLGY
jgi:4-amino-4-deoxychorismate lyase